MRCELRCPSNDFTCPYYKNELCLLDNAVEECDEFYGLDDIDYREEYTLDDLGNNWW